MSAGAEPVSSARVLSRRVAEQGARGAQDTARRARRLDDTDRTRHGLPPQREFAYSSGPEELKW